MSGCSRNPDIFLSHLLNSVLIWRIMYLAIDSAISEVTPTWWFFVTRRIEWLMVMGGNGPTLTHDVPWDCVIFSIISRDQKWISCEMDGRGGRDFSYSRGS